jgi:hypothetical protein
MSSRNQNRGTSLVLSVLAAAVLAIGVADAAGGPTCGRDAMSSGDVCLIDGERHTSEDRRAAAERAPLVNGLIALVLVGFAIGGRVRGHGAGVPHD